MESTAKHAVKSIHIDRVVYMSKPAAHTTILDAGGKAIYDETYPDLDAAVALLRVVWERFDYDEKPPRSYYDG